MASSIDPSQCLYISGNNYCANNITLIYYDGPPNINTTCTIETCSLLVAYFKYLPNLPGNYLYAVIFGILFLVSSFLGIWKKTWGYLAGLGIGTVVEVVGYAGRIMGHNDPFSFNDFLIYLILITIAPAFIAAAIYLCLARIIVVYGREHARFKPRTYSIVFMCSDFVALVLQGTGGGITSTASDQAGSQMGVNIMIAGLAWQVFSMSVFMAAAADFASSVRKAAPYTVERQFQGLVASKKWTMFLWALALATVTVYIRSIYRVAELSQGFDGPIVQKEIPFMILEGAMIIIASTALTVMHPALTWGNLWREADPGKSAKKNDAADSTAELKE